VVRRRIVNFLTKSRISRLPSRLAIVASPKDTYYGRHQPFDPDFALSAKQVDTLD